MITREELIKMQQVAIQEQKTKENNILYAMAYLASEKADLASLDYDPESLEFTFVCPKEFDDGIPIKKGDEYVMIEPVKFNQMEFEKALLVKVKHHNELVDRCELIKQQVATQGALRERIKALYQEKSPSLVPLASTPEKLLEPGQDPAA